MPRILLTNDDGILAPGIAAAHQALKKLGEVTVLAPNTEQSATSHAITLNRPLRMKEFAGKGYALDGKPADCVFLACEEVMKAAPPDLVVSGINSGGNLGWDVVYSGTVAAALEASLRGIPAIAISLVATHDFCFATAASFLADLAADVLRNGMPKGSVLNVNVPKAPKQPAQYSMTSLGRHHYADVIEKRIDPRQKPYYWIAGTWDGFEPIAGTDCVAIDAGVISVTPLRFNLCLQSQGETTAPRDLQGFEHAPT